MFIQEDKVSINYGFNINENNIKVVQDGETKKLVVRLKNGRPLAVNRISLKKPETTRAGYRPAENGKVIDIDKKMNNEIANLKASYDKKNIEHAIENIRNFFNIIAVKYNLQLDFSVER
ncbi:MAG: hypothetical protein IJU76_14600 [Desulfovibrionaceae bacterium]|nr:hypothetical protein [Desulfovibrionaceae bacterium]